jgi:hypothetical protein
VAKTVRTSIVMSRSDSLVAPETSKINETGIRNLSVQDYCANDTVRHGLIRDRDVWQIIMNEVEEKYDSKSDECDYDHILPGSIQLSPK